MAESVNQSKFAIFQNADGEPAVAARFENDDIWLTRQQLADLYHTTPQNVGQHLKVIESSGELDFSSKRKKFFTLDGGIRGLSPHLPPLGARCPTPRANILL